jgi:hypothetical protein
MNLLDTDDSFLNIAHFGALIVAVALEDGARTGRGSAWGWPMASTSTRG